MNLILKPCLAANALIWVTLRITICFFQEVVLVKSIYTYLFLNVHKKMIFFKSISEQLLFSRQFFILLLAKNQILLFNKHLRIWWDGMSQPDVTADDGTGADNGIASQNSGVGVNDYIIFNRWVALLGSQSLALRFG